MCDLHEPFSPAFPFHRVLISILLQLRADALILRSTFSLFTTLNEREKQNINFNLILAANLTHNRRRTQITLSCWLLKPFIIAKLFHRDRVGKGKDEKNELLIFFRSKVFFMNFFFVAVVVGY